MHRVSPTLTTPTRSARGYLPTHLAPQSTDRGCRTPAESTPQQTTYGQSRNTEDEPGKIRTSTPQPVTTESDRLAHVALTASIQTVSRTLELSLQSTFQLSLTVLVRYRTPASI